MTRKRVVIGAGMASGRVLEPLFENEADFEVTVFDGEARGNPNRIRLSPVLSGEKSYDDIVTHDAQWCKTTGVTCHFGAPVTAIDRAAKTVTSAAGTVAYDRLLIATGSAPFLIPVLGKDLPGLSSGHPLGPALSRCSLTA